MIQFGNIKIEGFCSIAELELNLGNTGITIIRGATGEGKTTILSALVWCLYGKNLKDKASVNTWKKYQTKDYQGTKVEIYWSSNGKVYHIVRCLGYKGEVNGAKGKDRLIYEIEAEEVKNKTKPEIQALIVADLGMSYDLFINSVLFGQGLKRLIQETSNDQKDLFEELFELSYISKAKDIAKERQRKIQETYTEYTTQRHGLVNNITSYEKLISELELLEGKGKRESREILDKKKRLKTEIKSLKARYGEFNVEKLQISERKAYELVSELKDKQTELSREFNDARDKTKISLEEFINELVKLLKAKKFSLALKKVLKVKDAFISTDKLQKALSDCTEKLLEAKDEHYEIGSKLKQANNIFQSITRLESTYDDLKVNNLVKDNSKLVAKYKKAIAKVKDKLSQLDDKYQGVETQMKDYQWLINEPLGNRGIKTFIFESSIDALNQILEGYADILGMSIIFYVDIQGVKKDFKISLVMEGMEVQYAELSGGQKQLVNLALAFAMNEMISQSKGINIVFLDEVFENLSSEYIEVVSGLIQKIYKHKTLFLISHHDSLPIANAHTLNVTRVKGISQYQ